MTDEKLALAERVIADAALLGDAAAAAKHKIHPRTVRKYRTLARREPQVRARALQKIEDVQRDWIQTAQADLASMTSRLREMCAKCKPTPEGIHAVAGAIKILSEAANARLFLEHKLLPQGSTTSLSKGS